MKNISESINTSLNEAKRDYRDDALIHTTPIIRNMFDTVSSVDKIKDSVYGIHSKNAEMLILPMSNGDTIFAISGKSVDRAHIIIPKTGAGSSKEYELSKMIELL